MAKVRMIVSGIFGKKGRLVVNAISQAGEKSRFQLVGGLEMPNHDLLGQHYMPWGDSYRVMSLDGKFRIPEDILPADVILDFSKPAVVAVADMQAAAKAKIPIVVCSKGHDPWQDIIQTCALEIPCVFLDTCPCISKLEASDMEGRTNFTRLAIRATSWVIGQKPGIYYPSHLL